MKFFGELQRALAVSSLTRTAVVQRETHTTRRPEGSSADRLVFTASNSASCSSIPAAAAANTASAMEELTAPGAATAVQRRRHHQRLVVASSLTLFPERSFRRCATMTATSATSSSSPPATDSIMRSDGNSSSSPLSVDREYRQRYALEEFAALSACHHAPCDSFSPSQGSSLSLDVYMTLYQSLFRETKKTKDDVDDVCPTAPMKTTSSMEEDRGCWVFRRPLNPLDQVYAVRMQELSCRLHVGLAVGQQWLLIARSDPAATASTFWQVAYIVADALSCTTRHHQQDDPFNLQQCLSDTAAAISSIGEELRQLFFEKLLPFVPSVAPSSSSSSSSVAMTPSSPPPRLSPASSDSFKVATFVTVAEWLAQTDSMSDCFTHCCALWSRIFPERHSSILSLKRSVSHNAENIPVDRSIEQVVGMRGVLAIARCAAHSAEWHICEQLLRQEEASGSLVSDAEGILALAFTNARRRSLPSSLSQGGDANHTNSNATPSETVMERAASSNEAVPLVRLTQLGLLPSRPIQITEFAQLLKHVLPAHRATSPVITATAPPELLPWSPGTVWQAAKSLPTPLRRALVVSCVSVTLRRQGVLPGKGVLSMDDLLVSVNTLRWRLATPSLSRHPLTMEEATIVGYSFEQIVMASTEKDELDSTHLLMLCDALMQLARLIGPQQVARLGLAKGVLTAWAIRHFGRTHWLPVETEAGASSSVEAYVEVLQGVRGRAREFCVEMGPLLLRTVLQTLSSSSRGVANGEAGRPGRLTSVAEQRVVRAVDDEVVKTSLFWLARCPVEEVSAIFFADRLLSSWLLREYAESVALFALCFDRLHLPPNAAAYLSHDTSSQTTLSRQTRGSLLLSAWLHRRLSFYAMTASLLQRDDVKDSISNGSFLSRFLFLPTSGLDQCLQDGSSTVQSAQPQAAAVESAVQQWEASSMRAKHQTAASVLSLTLCTDMPLTPSHPALLRLSLQGVTSGGNGEGEANAEHRSCGRVRGMRDTTAAATVVESVLLRALERGQWALGLRCHAVFSLPSSAEVPPEEEMEQSANRPECIALQDGGIPPRPSSLRKAAELAARLAAKLTTKAQVVQLTAELTQVLSSSSLSSSELTSHCEKKEMIPSVSTWQTALSCFLRYHARQTTTTHTSLCGAAPSGPSYFSKNPHWNEEQQQGTETALLADVWQLPMVLLSLRHVVHTMRFAALQQRRRSLSHRPPPYGTHSGSSSSPNSGNEAKTTPPLADWQQALLLLGGTMATLPLTAAEALLLHSPLDILTMTAGDTKRVHAKRLALPAASAAELAHLFPNGTYLPSAPMDDTGTALVSDTTTILPPRSLGDAALTTATAATTTTATLYAPLWRTSSSYSSKEESNDWLWETKGTAQWQQARTQSLAPHLPVKDRIERLLLSFCRNPRQWERAVVLYQDCTTLQQQQHGSGWVPVASLSDLMGACTAATAWHVALFLFVHTLRQVRRLPPATTTAALVACREGHRWQDALSILRWSATRKDDVRGRGDVLQLPPIVPGTPSTTTSLVPTSQNTVHTLQTLLLCGQRTIAAQLVQRLGPRRLADPVYLSIALRVLTENRMWNEAVDFFYDAIVQGVRAEGAAIEHALIAAEAVTESHKQVAMTVGAIASALEDVCRVTGSVLEHVAFVYERAEERTGSFHSKWEGLLRF